MRVFPNIEKSAFRKGEYVGWDSGGRLYRISRAGKHWRACHASVAPDLSKTGGTDLVHVVFNEPTHASVSAMLAKLPM